MVTTHLGDLKSYALGNPRAENAAVEFDIATLRPTYRLQVGQFGKSNALEIAKRLNLPKDLLRRAHHYLRRKRRRAPEITKLAELRQEMEQARADAIAARIEAERQQAEVALESELLARQSREAAALESAREQLKVGDVVHVARFDKDGRVVRVDLKHRLVRVSVGIGEWEVPLEEVKPKAR
jgi:DNA mismatch repair protein MutS2